MKDIEYDDYDIYAMPDGIRYNLNYCDSYPEGCSNCENSKDCYEDFNQNEEGKNNMQQKDKNGMITAIHYAREIIKMAALENGYGNSSNIIQLQDILQEAMYEIDKTDLKVRRGEEGYIVTDKMVFEVFKVPHVTEVDTLTGTPLSPGQPPVCLGNGQTPGFVRCCEHCDFKEKCEGRIPVVTPPNPIK